MCHTNISRSIFESVKLRFIIHQAVERYCLCGLVGNGHVYIQTINDLYFNLLKYSTGRQKNLSICLSLICRNKTSEHSETDQIS